MEKIDDGSTSPALLGAIADWANHRDWTRFRDTYGPRLERRCRRHGLDADSTDEVCQRIWIELADRMRTFEYDPGRSFRGWLGRLCDSRAIDYLRERRGRPFLGLDERQVETVVDARGQGNAPGLDAMESGENDGPEGTDTARGPLRLAAERAQAAVRARVKPHNWEAFWLVAVCDWSVERTARELEMTRTAVYAARERVARMLLEEGRREAGRMEGPRGAGTKNGGSAP